MKAFTYFALIASCQAVRLTELHKSIIESTGMHACDFVDDNGDEISTSLMPEYVQLNDEEPQEEAPASEEAAQVEEAPAAEQETEQAAEEEAPKKKGKKVEHVQVTEARNLMANVNADMEMATAKVEQEAAERTKAFALSQ